MSFICDSYRTITTKILSIHFNYLFLLLLISLETTTPHANFALIFFMIYLLTFNCQTSKIMTLNELKDKLTSSTSKSYRRQKFDYTKIAACLFCQLNSNQLQCWFSFSYIYYVCCVYNYKKSYIHKKWLLIIFTTYLYVCSMLSQLINNGFFLFSLTKIIIFSRKKKHVVEKIEIITAIVTQTWQLCIWQYQRMYC